MESGANQAIPSVSDADMFIKCLNDVGYRLLASGEGPVTTDRDLEIGEYVVATMPDEDGKFVTFRSSLATYEIRFASQNMQRGTFPGSVEFIDLSDRVANAALGQFLKSIVGKP